MLSTIRTLLPIAQFSWISANDGRNFNLLRFITVVATNTLSSKVHFISSTEERVSPSVAVQTMGAAMFLGTQCVRCYNCDKSQEVEVASVISRDPAELGNWQECPNCGEHAIGLSYYEWNPESLQKAVKKIRSRTGYNGEICCVHPWAVENQGHWMNSDN
eukprot:TRINITY_DN793_c0_g1_i3.p1 TRINITY_DN793_c0_g1~~TRINITY_DN793_c0_g1_i3.p1  ORF type:complete len:160 (-),score=27.53 TRINITY_DN793_c0_g1_i3:116-595(-)